MIFTSAENKKYLLSFYKIAQQVFSKIYREMLYFIIFGSKYINEFIKATKGKQR